MRIRLAFEFAKNDPTPLCSVLSVSGCFWGKRRIRAWNYSACRGADWKRLVEHSWLVEGVININRVGLHGEVPSCGIAEDRSHSVSAAWFLKILNMRITIIHVYENKHMAASHHRARQGWNRKVSVEYGRVFEVVINVIGADQCKEWRFPLSISSAFVFAFIPNVEVLIKKMQRALDAMQDRCDT